MNSFANASIKNIISSIIMQSVVMLIGLVLPRMYIVAYGSRVNGLVTSISTFISYFTIVEAGLASAGINALYKPIADGDKGKVNGVLCAIQKYYFQVGIIFSGLIAGLALLYPLFITLEGFSYGRMAILVLILGSHGLIDFFTLSKYRSLLTADQKYYVVANATTIAYILNFAVVFWSIRSGASIIVVRLLALTLYIVRSLIINVYVSISYKRISLKCVPDESALNKRWDAMFLQLLGLAQTAMPTLILTFLANDLATISVYAVYNLVATSIISIILTATNGVSASFGYIIARGDNVALQKKYYEYENLLLSVNAIIYSCVFVMYIPFISLYTEKITDFNYIVPLTATLFTLNGLAYNIKTPAGTLIGAAGVFKDTKKGTIIQTIIAVVGCCSLTPLWGINGLLIGLIASNVYRDVELVLYMNRNVIKSSSYQSIRSISACLLSFTIICTLSCIIPHSVDSVELWIILGIITFFISSAVTFTINYFLNKNVFMEGVLSIWRWILAKKKK